MSIACRSEPIPLVARAGTSVTILLVGEFAAGEPGSGFSGNNVGFGGEVYANEGFTDVQRGEVEFLLSKGSSWMTIRPQLVTRVFPDPASDIARNNGASAYGLEALGIGQVLAIVHLPPEALIEQQLGVTLPDDLYLSARRIVPGDPPQILGSLQYGEWLRVLPTEAGGEDDVPNEVFLKWGGQWAQDDALAQQLYPHPKLLVNLPYPLPSAAHLEIEIPDEVTFLNVFEEQHYGRKSVIVAGDPVDLPVDGEGQLLTIDFVNLESPAQVDKLAIAFRPGLDYTRIADAAISENFTVQAASFWDEDGNPIHAGVLPTFAAIR